MCLLHAFLNVQIYIWFLYSILFNFVVLKSYFINELTLTDLPERLGVGREQVEVFLGELQRRKSLQFQMSPCEQEVEQPFEGVQTQTVIPVVGQVRHEYANLRKNQTYFKAALEIFCSRNILYCHISLYTPFLLNQYVKSMQCCKQQYATLWSHDWYNYKLNQFHDLSCLVTLMKVFRDSLKASLNKTFVIQTIVSLNPFKLPISVNQF